MKVPPGPGPAKYDRVFVKQLGPANARTVLVLVPGTTAARAASCRSRATSSSGCRARRCGSSTAASRRSRTRRSSRRAIPQAAQDYYLGFHYRRVAGEDAKFAPNWGLKLQLERPAQRDRRAARAGGRRVFLGGHSAGASTAVAYAAWDFGGRPGYRDIDGLVLIDGGLLGSFASADLRAREVASSPTFAPARSSSTSSGSASRRSTGYSPRWERCGRRSGPTSRPCCRTIRRCRRR